MAAFSIATFATLANLLLAARKLASDPDPLNRIKALSDLATNTKALNAAIHGSGLSPLAVEMADRAGRIDRFLTHEGHAKDDAKAIFWQVVPVAIADPAYLTNAALDAEAATSAMVVAIRATGHARDFGQTPYAETYFRKVMTGTLETMLAEKAFIDGITPALWRQSLANQGIQIEFLTSIDDTTRRTETKVDEIKALLLRHLDQTGEAQTARDSGITDARIVALAQQVAADVDDPEQAFRELEAAIAGAIAYRNAPTLGANADAALADLRIRLEALADAGQLAEAQSQANAALQTWEAEEAHRQARANQTGIAFLSEAIRRDLDMRDADAAAEKISRRVALETSDSAAHFEALRDELRIWYERGRDKGLRLDLEIAIALARIIQDHAGTADQLGTALNDLGLALSMLGRREADLGKLDQAVAAYTEALKVFTRDSNPLQRATTQNNLGTALAMLGERELGTDRLNQAVVAFTEALKGCVRDSDPLQWAGTQSNLGLALQTLGERETGTGKLNQAVAAHTEALKVQTRDSNPLDWVATQMNLGNALAALGRRETGTGKLDRAVAAYTEVLKVYTRDRLPLDWAKTQNNLGNALRALGERVPGTDRLDQAVAAYTEALKVYTRDSNPLDWAKTQSNLGNALAALGQREPGKGKLDQAVGAFAEALKERTRDRVPLQWAMTQGNLCNVHLAYFDKTGDPARLDAAQAALDGAREVFQQGGAGHHLIMADVQQAEINARRA